MTKRKIILTVLSFLIIIGLLAGCNAKKDPPGNSNAPDNGVMDRSDRIYAQFQGLVDNGTDVQELINFLDLNISEVSKPYATRMVNDFIVFLEKNMTDIPAGLTNYSYEKLKDHENIEDKYIREYMERVSVEFYSLIAPEGMVDIIIDYGLLYKRYGKYPEDSISEYLRIRALETETPFGMDGGVAISIGELAERISDTDKMIIAYPEHLYMEQANTLFNRYMYAYMGMYPNTPGFDALTGRIYDEFLENYRHSVAEYPGTRFSAIITRYLELLEESDYMKTDEIMGFVVNVLF
ncbi:MAG: hypothetical protein R6W96_06460 [Clostridia bacterium]